MVYLKQTHFECDQNWFDVDWFNVKAKHAIWICFKVSIDNITVKQVSTTKSIGMLIDGNLVWHSQIDKITQKIASGIGAIEQIRPFAQLGTLRYICNALVQPHFSYCSAVWKIAVKRYQP